jgi:hypothetical protein
MRPHQPREGFTGEGARPKTPPNGGLAEGQIRRLALFGTKGAVGLCRDFARDAMRDWGWLPATGDPDLQESADDVLLVVSELVTNACLHAGGPTSLLLRGSAAVVRVEVHDTSTQRPRPRTPHDLAGPGGHGLYVIERLARRWGVTPHEDGSGKCVWAEILAPPGR